MTLSNLLLRVLKASIILSGLYQPVVFGAELIEFQAGTPAKASEVNQNFEALKAEIEALKAAIQDVERPTIEHDAPVSATGGLMNVQVTFADNEELTLIGYPDQYSCVPSLQTTEFVTQDTQSTTKQICLRGDKESGFPLQLTLGALDASGNSTTETHLIEWPDTKVRSGYYSVAPAFGDDLESPCLQTLGSEARLRVRLLGESNLTVKVYANLQAETTQYKELVSNLEGPWSPLDLYHEWSRNTSWYSNGVNYDFVAENTSMSLLSVSPLTINLEFSHHCSVDGVDQGLFTDQYTLTVDQFDPTL